MSDRFRSPHYRECHDDECPVRFAYRQPNGELAPHYHFTGSDLHPAWDVA